MRRHGEHWNRLTAGQQARYDREAVKVRASKKEEIALEIAALRRQLEAERDSVREDALDCSDSMVISVCKWTPELLVQFDAFCQSGAITPPVFAELRKKSTTCPP
eukprot:889782-Amphidinium_carterae.1